MLRAVPVAHQFHLGLAEANHVVLAVALAVVLRCHLSVAVVVAVAAVAPRRQVVAAEAEHRLGEGSVIRELVLVAVRAEEEPVVHERLAPRAVPQHEGAVVNVVLVVRDQQVEARVDVLLEPVDVFCITRFVSFEQKKKERKVQVVLLLPI